MLASCTSRFPRSRAPFPSWARTGGHARPDLGIALVARMGQKSCVLKKYGLSYDDPSDERTGPLRDEAKWLREELSRRERENDRRKR